MNRIIIAVFTLLISSAALAQPQGPGPGGQGANSPGTLTQEQADTLVFMREEEKMARDVYIELDGIWHDFIFQNISWSEQRHMDSLLTMLNLYGIPDPVVDDSVGEFTNDVIGQLYDDMLLRGDDSFEEALHAGAYVEEIDIRDLRLAIAEATDTPLIKTYENLLAGARNHLRAFVSRIRSMGTDYVAQELSQTDVDQIVGPYNNSAGPGPGAGPGFNINAGLTDAWYYPQTTGQGFFISVYPDERLVFLAWFTYDTDRPDESVTANLGEPGHRWLTALGPYSGSVADLQVSLSSGGVFDSILPGVENESYGSIVLEFEDCNKGSVLYDIPSIGLAGYIPITRIAPDKAAHCRQLNEASR